MALRKGSEDIRVFSDPFHLENSNLDVSILGFTKSLFASLVKQNFLDRMKLEEKKRHVLVRAGS